MTSAADAWQVLTWGEVGPGGQVFKAGSVVLPGKGTRVPIFLDYDAARTVGSAELLEDESGVVAKVGLPLPGLPGGGALALGPTGHLDAQGRLVIRALGVRVAVLKDEAKQARNDQDVQVVEEFLLKLGEHEGRCDGAHGSSEDCDQHEATFDRRRMAAKEALKRLAARVAVAPAPPAPEVEGRVTGVRWVRGEFAGMPVPVVELELPSLVGQLVPVIQKMLGAKLYLRVKPREPETKVVPRGQS
jgi:hypothetical protein